MRLVLTNAIYFNGSWKYKFDASATPEETFYRADGAESQVRMMWQQQQFAYAERPGFQMLEMPYAGDDLSMVVMLPNEPDQVLTQLKGRLQEAVMIAKIDALCANHFGGGRLL